MAKKIPAPSSDAFVKSYLETALWSSTDESDESGGNPLDDNYSIDDVADEALAKATKDCNAFIKAAGKKLDEAGDDGQNGHDFWLTRNRHGAGFWDRGYGKVGDELTEIAHGFGEVNAYIGDDGKIYIS